LYTFSTIMYVLYADSAFPGLKEPKKIIKINKKYADDNTAS